MVEVEVVVKEVGAADVQGATGASKGDALLRESAKAALENTGSGRGFRDGGPGVTQRDPDAFQCEDSAQVSLRHSFTPRTTSHLILI